MARATAARYAVIILRPENTTKIPPHTHNKTLRVAVETNRSLLSLPSIPIIMSGIDRFSRGRKKTTNNSQPPAADPSPVMGSTTTAGGGFGGGDDFGFMGGSFGGFGFDTQQEQGFGGFSGGGDAPTNEVNCRSVN